MREEIAQAKKAMGGEIWGSQYQDRWEAMDGSGPEKVIGADGEGCRVPLSL